MNKLECESDNIDRKIQAQASKSLLRVQPPFSMSISMPGLVPPSKLQIQAIRAESQVWQVYGEWVKHGCARVSQKVAH